MYTNKEYITMYSIRIIKYMCVYGIRIKRVKNGKREDMVCMYICI